MAAGDTIFACSSGAGRAGIAVWRISGAAAGPAFLSLTGRDALPEPRRAVRVNVQYSDGLPFDDGLGLWFPGPASATGEDMAECHVHGSGAVGAMMTESLLSRGLRHAEPGEFTRRALLNGKIDLIETEGLGQLLEAETRSQLLQARDTLAGVGRDLVDTWRGLLVQALAILEAAIDFPDEEDVPAQIAEQAVPKLNDLRRSLEQTCEEARKGRRLADGLTMVIAGPPNAGKSTLLNWLAGEDRAIVSDIPGTTRDAISVRLDIGGRLVNVIDTAGLRGETNDPIEREGIRRSHIAVESADIVLMVRAPDMKEIVLPSVRGRVLRVVTKADLHPDCVGDVISFKSGQGLETFLDELTTLVASEAAPSPFARERHVHCLERANSHIAHALEATAIAPELAAAHLHEAVRALDSLVGRILPDEVLGEIFSAFCIGK